MPTKLPAVTPEKFEAMTVQERMDYLAARLKHLNEQLEETRRQMEQASKTAPKG